MTESQTSIANQVKEKEIYDITFTKENTAVIQQMQGCFGSDEEAVVINALILLYTIYQKCPEAKTLYALTDSGDKTLIPLSKILKTG